MSSAQLARETTLLYVVGTTKSGTSWLHRYFADHPECGVTTLKEYHFFDSYEKGHSNFWLRKLRERKLVLRAKLNNTTGPKKPLKRKLADLNGYLPALRTLDEQAYLHFLMEGSADKKVVADITPAYSMVSADTFETMRDLHPKTKFLLILRDPVARLWSNMRMSLRKKLGSEQDMEQVRADLFAGLQSGTEESLLRRSDYKSMVQTLESVVPAANRHICFYEDIFKGEGLQGICDFLEIAPQAGKFGKVVHGGLDIKITAQESAMLRELLQDQYAFAQSKFANLPASWQQ